MTYFLALRSKILSQIGTFNYADVRGQDQTDDVTTMFVRIDGSSKNIVEVNVDLVEEGGEWHVVDLHLENEEK